MSHFYILNNVFRLSNLINYTQNYKIFSKPYSVFNLIFIKNKNFELNKYNNIRYYAKNKDKKKEKGKTKVSIDERQLSEVINVELLKTQMETIIEHLKNDFTKNVSLRSSSGSIESMLVDFDGKEYTFQEIAQISRKNPKIITANMAVFPQAIPAVVKAIEKSGMNLNPYQEGTTLIIPVPKITTEHRQMLLKNAKSLFNKHKTSVRDVQNKFIKTLKKKEKLSEDIIKNSEQQIVAIGDNFIQEVERIFNKKEIELIGQQKK